MIVSMTGFGKGEVREGGGAISVEVRTVNHRFIDCSIRIPRSLNGYERDIEKIVRGVVKRGHVYVTVTIDKGLEKEGFSIDKEFLRRVYHLLTEFAIEEGIPGRVDIGALISLPDVLSAGLEGAPPESLWERVRCALGLALERCGEMRRSEGAELGRDVARRLVALERGVARIEKKAPAALRRSVARAKARFRQLLDGAGIDETRWLAEAALMAERIDFSEELVRLRSHLAQFRTALDKGGEVSKSLTFLLQEMHRETTTTANKAADAAIIGECLALKEGIEKIREQVQNLE